MRSPNRPSQYRTPRSTSEAFGPYEEFIPPPRREVAFVDYLLAAGIGIGVILFILAATLFILNNLGAFDHVR